jgi:hypothetical protein
VGVDESRYSAPDQGAIAGTLFATFAAMEIVKQAVHGTPDVPTRSEHLGRPDRGVVAMSFSFERTLEVVRERPIQRQAPPAMTHTWSA